MLNTGDILDSRYEILTRIGQGGMSVVYKAKDTKLGRVVAIKMLKEELAQDEEFVERFKNEARSAAQLSHTNIVATYDIVNSGNQHYIVMELVEGITLKDYISRKGKLSNKETIGIALQTAEGLSEAHKNGIIHRDIKSQNIIISKEGRIKIADFGIAGAANASADLQSNALIGSAHYMAPEQAENGETHENSDLYSLGISMYEMITGQLPYDGDNAEHVVMAHIQEALVPPNVYNSEIYPALNDIIIKATKKMPEDRYQTAEEMVEDLKHAAADPDGHFVKMYDSIGSSELANEKAGGNVSFIKPIKANIQPDTADDDSDMKIAGSTSSQAEQTAKFGPVSIPEDDPDLMDTEMYDDSKTKFIILGVTVFVLVLVVLIASFLIKSRKDAVSAAESNLATEAVQGSTGENGEINYTLSIQGEDVMPDLSGMTEAEASALLASIHMSMDSSTTDYSDKYAKGTIMNQSPAKGEVLTSDSTVYVTVSLGKRDEYVIENLKNMNEGEARETLEEAGIIVAEEVEHDFSDEVAEDMVIGCRDIASEDGKHVVALILSYGKQDDYVVMPNITGMTVADAAEYLSTGMLAIGTVSALNTDEANINEIVEQSVNADGYVKKGSTVDVVICVGDDNSIPDGTILPSSYSGSSIKTPDSAGTLSPDYYYGTIDTSCVIGDPNGPGGSGNVIHVAVRLAQRVDGSIEYTMLSEPIPVSSGTRIPVSYKNIRGAYGVEDGTIEVIDSDSGAIYSSYVISFDPID